jgi:hypothetical protein
VTSGTIGRHTTGGTERGVEVNWDYELSMDERGRDSVEVKPRGWG